MSTVLKNSDRYFIYAVLLFALIPINYVPQLLDGVHIEYAFTIGDISAVDLWYREASRYSHLLIVHIVDVLVKYSGLSAELILDNLLVIVLLLFCIEVKKYSIIFFRLDNHWGNIAALFTALFPMWHVLVDFDIGQYLISIYLLFFGFRLFVDKGVIKNVIGACFVVLSFNVESNLSMVVGLGIFALAFKQEEKSYYFPFIKLIVLIVLAIGYIFVRAFYIPPHGMLEGYLSVAWNSWGGGTGLTKNLLNYLSFLFAFMWIPLTYYIHLYWRNGKCLAWKDFGVICGNKCFSHKSAYIWLIGLAGVAIAPYLLLNLSTSLINLTDYRGRNAFLLAPISAIFFALMFRDMSVSNTLPKTIKFRNYIAIFVCINAFLLSYGFYRKVETHHFRNHVVDQLQSHGSIPKGNVQLIGENIPGALRFMEISHLLYRAYGVAGWWGEVVPYQIEWMDGSGFYFPKIWKNIKGNKLYLSLFMMDEYAPKCTTYIFLGNTVEKYERIRKLYVFNSGSYYNIKKIESEC